MSHYPLLDLDHIDLLLMMTAHVRYQESTATNQACYQSCVCVF